MPLTVVATYSVAWDKSPVWKIDAQLIKTVDAQQYVKLRPYEQSLIRIVCHNFLELPKNSKFSLASTAGWNKLIELRNSVAFAPTTKTVAASGLFGTTVVEPKKKKHRPARLNASQLQELRATPTRMEFEVPGCDGFPDLLISSLQPAHPCDELWIRLNADSLEHVFRFLRLDLDVEMLGNRRSYASSSQTGVWSNGSAGLIRKIGTDVGEDGRGSRRYKSLNNEPRAESFGITGALGDVDPEAPLVDQPECAGVVQDHDVDVCELRSSGA